MCRPKRANYLQGSLLVRDLSGFAETKPGIIQIGRPKFDRKSFQQTNPRRVGMPMRPQILDWWSFSFHSILVCELTFFICFFFFPSPPGSACWATGCWPKKARATAPKRRARCCGTTSASTRTWPCPAATKRRWPPSATPTSKRTMSPAQEESEASLVASFSVRRRPVCVFFCVYDKVHRWSNRETRERERVELDTRTRPASKYQTELQ